MWPLDLRPATNEDDSQVLDFLRLTYEAVIEIERRLDSSFALQTPWVWRTHETPWSLANCCHHEADPRPVRAGPANPYRTVWSISG